MKWATTRSRKLAPLFLGFAAQACSSATSFGLALIGARVLGPSGAGTMFVGFSAYLLLLGLARGLVTSPLVAASAVDGPAGRADSARKAITFTLAASLVAACCVSVVGAALPSRLGLGILLFAPWLVPALVQDLGRSIVFRDLGGGRPVLSDAAWLFVMVAFAPLVFYARRDWLVVATWGIGATVGAAVSLALIHYRPVPVREAIRWWRSSAWSFGRWLVLGGSFYGLASYVSVLALAGILGARDYGGLRVVQSIFGPLTLIGPAMTLPGLPLVSRAIADSPRRGCILACQLAALVTAVTFLYVGLLYEFPGVLAIAFGRTFQGFQSIILPVGIGQLLAAPRFGLMLLLTARRQGRALTAVGTLNALLLVSSSIALGSLFGLTGAAWAGAASSSLGAAILIGVFIRVRGRELTPGSPPVS